MFVRRSPELFLGSKKKKKNKKTLGDVRKDRFKAFGGVVIHRDLLDDMPLI